MIVVHDKTRQAFYSNFNLSEAILKRINTAFGFNIKSRLDNAATTRTVYSFVKFVFKFVTLIYFSILNVAVNMLMILKLRKARFPIRRINLPPRKN